MELCVFLGQCRIGNFLLCTNHSHQWDFSNPGMVWSSLTFSAISVYVYLHILSVVVVYRNDVFCPRFATSQTELVLTQMRILLVDVTDSLQGPIQHWL
jgi:hypothetical protein